LNYGKEKLLSVMSRVSVVRCYKEYELVPASFTERSPHYPNLSLSVRPGGER